MPMDDDTTHGGALNRASYNAVAADWAAARTQLYGPEQRYLEALLNGLAAPGHVLDAGCGTGRPIAEEVIARGHRVTGIDQAEQLLALAAERFPAERWIHAALEEYPFGGEYDAAICWDSLFHIHRMHHRAILERIVASLVPGGRLMLTVGGSAHPAFTDTMFGQEFFYDSHPPEAVSELLGELGLRLIIAEFMNPPTSGRDKGRYAIVAQLE